jgi:acyl-CoA synthetase (AMP-forming)/AMP-acid ligase II/pimeloyl-ACP methyl ester carboxylesterase
VDIKKLFPFEPHFLEVDGFKLHYVDEGTSSPDKPTVLLLHGNPTWSFYYRNLIVSLRDKFRVIAPDYIGCGLSDHPANQLFRAIDRINHLQTLIDHLGLKRFSLVMHDWGGAIGTALAVRNLDRLDRLIYLNTTLTETESLPRIIRQAARPIIGKYLTKYSMRFLKLTTGFGVCHKLSRAVRQGYCYPYQTSKRRTAIWGFVADIPFDDTHPSYGEMLDLAGKLPLLAKTPVKIIWGLRDPCFHREMLSKVAEHFPQADVLEIADASHLVLEDAKEVANNAIKSFLLSESDDKSGGLTALRQDGAPSELYASFLKCAESIPSKQAVISPGYFLDAVHYTQLNYRDLALLINKYQRGLTELGLVRGDKVLMLVSPGSDFLALSYAIMARGGIPVFIDPGMAREDLFKCINQLDPAGFIGTPKAQLLRLKRKKLFPSLKFHLTSSEWPFARGPNLSFLRKFASKPLPPVASTGTSLIAFTSGATGLAKGVIFTETMMKSQLSIFKDVFGLEAGGKDLPLLPIFSLFTVAIGVCSVFPPMNPSQPLALEPDRIVKIINDLSVDYSFGSPTLWNKIAEYCVRSHSTLGSIKKIFMAGAPVPPSTLECLQSIIPNGKTYTPYGATEALPITLIEGSEIVGAKTYPASSGEIGTLVGRVIPGLELRVIESVEGPIGSIAECRQLACVSVGEMIVRGENISPTYLDRQEATNLAKIQDDAGFWHRMGDMGYLDEQGNVYFCGRKAHMVQTGTRTFYSVPTERIFNEHPKVRRSALVQLDDGLIAIVVEPHPQYWPQTSEEREAFATELRRLGQSSELTREISKFFFHPSFPVDVRHNAKIFRDKLGVWASRVEKLDQAA